MSLPIKLNPLGKTKDTWDYRVEYFQETVNSTRSNNPAYEVYTGYVNENFGFEVDIGGLNLDNNDYNFIGTRAKENSTSVTDSFRFMLNVYNKTSLGEGFGAWRGARINNLDMTQRRVYKLNFLNDKKIWAGDTSATLAATTFSAKIHFMIMAQGNSYVPNDMTSVQGNNERIYRFRMSNGTEIIRDCVPCIKNGQPMFYDFITKQFFANIKSSYSPVVGPRVKSNGDSYIPYIREGLISLFDGIDNVDCTVHNSASLYWRDLVDNNKVYRNSSNCDGTFTTNGLVCHSGIGAASTTSDKVIPITNNSTIEIVLNLASAMSSGTEQIIAPFSAGHTFRPSGETRDARNGTIYLYSYPSYSRFFQVMTANPTICYTDNSGTISSGVHTWTFRGNGQPVKDGVVNSGAQALNITLFATAIDTRQKVISIGGIYGNNAANYRAESMMPNGTIIHCVRVYNRLLSDEEIATNRAIDRARFNF